jgi:hypothetical protein
VVARIDHAAAARQAGMELAAEEVVVFGNPRAGTPLMQSDPPGYHVSHSTVQRYGGREQLVADARHARALAPFAASTHDEPNRVA